MDKWKENILDFKKCMLKKKVVVHVEIYSLNKIEKSECDMQMSRQQALGWWWHQNQRKENLHIIMKYVLTSESDINFFTNG